METISPEVIGKILGRNDERSTLYKRVHYSAGSCAQTLGQAVDFWNTQPDKHLEKVAWLHGIAQKAARQELGFSVKHPEQFYRLSGQLAYRTYLQEWDMTWWANTVEGFGLAAEVGNPVSRAASAIELAQILEVGMPMRHAQETLSFAMHLLERLPDCPQYQEKILRHIRRLGDM